MNNMDKEIQKIIDTLEGLQYNIHDEMEYHYKGYACCDEQIHKYDDDFKSIKDTIIKLSDQCKQEKSVKTKPTRLTKFFVEDYDGGDDIDAKINSFIEENNYKIVDVKYQLATNGYNCALLIYDTMEEVK